MTIGSGPTKTESGGDIPTAVGLSASDLDQSESNPYARLDELVRELEGNGSLTSEQLEELKEIEPAIVRDIGTAMFHMISTQEPVESPKYRPRIVDLQWSEEATAQIPSVEIQAVERSQASSGTVDGLTAWYVARLCHAVTDNSISRY